MRIFRYFLRHLDKSDARHSPQRRKRRNANAVLLQHVRARRPKFCAMTSISWVLCAFARSIRRKARSSRSAKDARRTKARFIFPKPMMKRSSTNGFARKTVDIPSMILITRPARAATCQDIPKRDARNLDAACDAARAEDLKTRASQQRAKARTELNLLATTSR